MTNGKYRHFKGNVYTVICNARHSETDEDLVIYQTDSDHIWARPKSMFLEDVTVDGKTVPRFQPIYDE